MIWHRLRRRFVVAAGITVLLTALWRAHEAHLLRVVSAAGTPRLTCGPPCRDATLVVLGRALYPDVYVPVVVLAVFWALLARVVRNSRRGPLVVDDVVDASGPDGATVTPSLAAQQVAAIMRDRLANSGTQPAGLFPSYTEIDSGAEESLSASPVAVSGFVARLGFGVFRSTTQRLGWRLSATIRVSEEGQHGLTIVLEHIATRRHELVRTVWGDSLAETAREASYIVSAWYQSRLGSPSSRSAPAGRVSATSLRCIEDARFFLAERRFDEAIDAARRGLEDDPTNLALRRLLGEVYERLGLSLAALDVYASGIVQVLDSDNSWSSVGGLRVPRPWPYSDLRRDWLRLGLLGVLSALGRGYPRAGRRSQLRVRSVEALGLLWRYLFVLSVADQWVDRWVITVMRRETTWRNRSNGRPADGPRGEGPWDYPSGWTTTDLSFVAHDEVEFERREREELAKRMRGFLATRYETLLDSEFPLLRAAWFAEQADRGEPFLKEPADDPDAPRRPGAEHRPPDAATASTTSHDVQPAGSNQRRLPGPTARAEAAVAGAGTPNFRTRWLLHEETRFPLDEPFLGDVAPEQDEATADRVHFSLWGIERRIWVGELRRLYRLLVRHAPAGTRGEASQRPGAGTTPTSAQHVVAESLWRLGLSEVEQLGHVAEALDPDLSMKAQNRWRELKLDRVLVVEVATWAAHHLTRLAHTGNGPALTDDDHQLCLRLRAQLDLRLFAHRAALEEVRRARAHLEIRRSHRLPRRAAQLMRLKARFAYLDRMRQLLPAGAAVPPDLQEIRVTTVEAAQHLTRHRWPKTLRPADRAFTVRKSWNLYYYCACVVATALEEAPEDRRPGDPGPDVPGVFESWKIRNDPLAEIAVRALNHSLLVSGRREATGLDEGAMDWLLYEDPDLDRLRLHPRFERWASATFARTVVSQSEAEADRWMREQRLRTLEAEEYDNSGVLGLSPRWQRDHRRWWLVSDYYLVESIGAAAPLVADRWRQTAGTLQAGSGRNLSVAELTALAAHMRLDRTVWRRLTLYRRFGARPDLRLAAAQGLSRLAGPRLGARPFPTSSQALLARRGMDYREVDRVLVSLVRESDAAAEPLGRRLLGRSVTPTRRAAVRAAMAAARRWDVLCAAVADPPR